MNLFIDGCLRGELSRTKRLADAFLSAYGGEWEREELNALPLLPLDRAALDERTAILERGEFSHPMLQSARRFAAAECIVVAAPLWDMGVPAKLKTYFEHVSVAGITFRVDARGDCIGCASARQLIYLTTRGMELPDGHIMEQATPYLKALSLFFGISEFHAVSAWGLDMVPPDEVEARLSRAEAAARELALSLRG